MSCQQSKTREARGDNTVSFCVQPPRGHKPCSPLRCQPACRSASNEWKTNASVALLGAGQTVNAQSWKVAFLKASGSLHNHFVRYGLSDHMWKLIHERSSKTNRVSTSPCLTGSDAARQHPHREKKSVHENGAGAISIATGLFCWQ